MIHKTEIDGKNLKDLAEEIGNLRYDALAEFLTHLSDKLHRDSFADEDRNRPRLAYMLKQAGHCIWYSMCYTQDAWDLCKKFMVEEK